ncbi:branched-chain amino acid transaminase [Acaryochloris sp. CCMEE 5410]|uniref:branched-chain amino acid transaminase n=1 Tax=Acaryochloris sp. CCMEE 5410 TaxID=310037 RepID=UPI0002484C03|nr:branched-chain amino acid transaminase [Acaryochloris sp. CCMEE 5410]KAI9132611.1 branched-chain amino acid transaminase [Acaryochloris sp. CCMEE 5410]
MTLLTQLDSSTTVSAPAFLPIAFFEGEFCPFPEAQLSIATHALHYGTSVLGGIRGIPSPSDSNQILMFRLADHCRRLSQSAKYLNTNIDPIELEATFIEFVRCNQPQTTFYIRPLIYTSSLGIAPRLHDVSKDLLIYGLEMGDYLHQGGVRCRISSWLRQEDRSQPLRGKSSAAYIASALAKTEAVASGFDEAILMNARGKVSEASAMNLFLVRNGQLITPSVDQDILEGITRASVMALATDLDIPIIERPVDKSELFIADEVFLCGTAAQISPVLEIETYLLPEHRPVTEQLRELLKKVMLGSEQHYSEWLTRVHIGSA